MQLFHPTRLNFGSHFLIDRSGNGDFKSIAVESMRGAFDLEPRKTTVILLFVAAIQNQRLFMGFTPIHQVLTALADEYLFVGRCYNKRFICFKKY